MNRLSIAWVTMLALLLGPPALAADCPISNLPGGELVAWLTANRDIADPECVAAAISRLGELKNASAVPVLIDLLAFERPETDREKLHISTTHDRFPAVPALSSIGEAAVPPLLRRIRTEDLTPIFRKNALRALILIYRENPVRAVKALQQDVPNAKTAAETDRLRSAMNETILTCPNTWRARCAAAAQKKE